MKSSKSSKIRHVYIKIGPEASNREIAEQCRKDHNFTPSASLIYETLGAENTRKLDMFKASEISEIKNTANRMFNGDVDRLILGAEAAKGFGK